MNGYAEALVRLQELGWSIKGTTASYDTPDSEIVADFCDHDGQVVATVHTNNFYEVDARRGGTISHTEETDMGEFSGTVDQVVQDLLDLAGVYTPPEHSQDVEGSGSPPHHKSHPLDRF